MARGPYQKLSGRSTFSVQKAYLGADHLLIVDGFFKESAKRIQYNDIEAILICPTKGGSVLSLLAGLGGLLFTGIALANWQTGSFVPWLIVAGVVWFLFGLGLYGKGSAVFGLQTAVQTVILSGLGTRRKSARARTQLSERIEAVQGRLSAEALRAAHDAQRTAAWAERGRSKPTAGATAHATPGSPPPIQKRPDADTTAGEGEPA